MPARPGLGHAGRAALQPVLTTLNDTGLLPDLFDGSWNEDAHVELTLTIADLRRMVNFHRRCRGREPIETQPFTEDDADE